MAYLAGVGAAECPKRVVVAQLFVFVGVDGREFWQSKVIGR
jgi:hypothetical protein